MSDNFETRLRSAATAGWWTWLIAAGVFLLQWIAYLLVVSAQPDWLLTLWGPGSTWPEVRHAWFIGLAGFKVLLAMAAFVLVWLTLWARRLRTLAGRP
jgi:hypothetical protein